MPRKRTYLSPSQLLKWESEPKEYYIMYLAENKVPRSPQTAPMALGSAFDVRVKSSLRGRFKLGEEAYPYTPEEGYQRSIENGLMRKEAIANGEVMMQSYLDSGAYQALVEEALAGGDVTTLRMEVDETVDLWGVPFVYKPDWECDGVLKTLTGESLPVIIDWKVNGFYSKSSTSPKQGYAMIRDGWKASSGFKSSRGNLTAHKKFVPMTLVGEGGRRVVVNQDNSLYMPGGAMDQWSVQTAIYSIGACVKRGIDLTSLDVPTIVGIEQLACKHLDPDNGVTLPRIASHRWLCTKEIRATLRERILRMWETIHSDHVFRWLSKDESLALQEECERIAELGKDWFLFT